MKCNNNSCVWNLESCCCDGDILREWSNGKPCMAWTGENGEHYVDILISFSASAPIEPGIHLLGSEKVFFGDATEDLFPNDIEERMWD